jgi:hypothetical protein
VTDPAPRPDRPDPTEVFGEHRDVLMSVAYRVLGRVADAEGAPSSGKGKGPAPSLDRPGEAVLKRGR